MEEEHVDSESIVVTTMNEIEDLTKNDDFISYRQEFDPDMEFSDRVLRRFFYLADRNPKLSVLYAKKFASLWQELATKSPNDKVLEEIKTNKMRFGGVDKKGRKIVHFYYHMHDPKEFTVQNTMKLFFFLMDIALDNEITAKEGMVFICWMRGSGWSNFDLASERYFTECTDAMSPMSMKMMHQMILVDSPWYVWAALKLMSPFLTQEIRAKLAMVSEAELCAKFSKEALKPNDEFLECASEPGYTPWK